MKSKFISILKFAAAILLFTTLNLQLSTTFVQGTAFTNQGRVTDNGRNFNGTVQFKRTLGDYAGNFLAGNQMKGPQT